MTTLTAPAAIEDTAFARLEKEGRMLNPVLKAPTHVEGRFGFRGELALRFADKMADEARPPELKCDQVMAVARVGEHASHDRRACADAAADRVDQVPFSGPHRLVRLLLQAALQAALRDQGKAWGAYELNHALVLALNRPDAQAAWQQGEDPLADAAADLELREAMAAGFDEMRR